MVMLTTCAFIAADAHAQTNQDLAELQDLAAIEKRITELQSLLTAKRLDIDKSNIVPYTIYRRQDRLADIVRRLNGLETDLVESEKPVYLDDDRTNYYDANAHQKAAAQSVAVVVRDVDLIDVDEHHYTLPQQRLGLCVGERFRNEPAPGKCSAFKIGPDLVATAGHCVADDNNDQFLPRCSDVSFVYGFRMNSAHDKPNRMIPKKQVYACAQVIAGSRNRDTGEDWRVARVDRMIDDAIPTVQINSQRTLSKGDNVTVIGHPSGLPVKITPNGIVRDVKEIFFITTSDTFGGNSGSPAFDTEKLESGTMMVEGILVRGENDYVKEDGCVKAQVCEFDGCKGEAVTFSTFLDGVK